MNYDYVKESVDHSVCPPAAVILGNDDYARVAELVKESFDWNTPKEVLLDKAFEKYLQTKLNPHEAYVVLYENSEELVPYTFVGNKTIEDLGESWIRFAMSHKLNLRAFGFCSLAEYAVDDDMEFAKYIAVRLRDGFPSLKADIISRGDVILMIEDSCSRGRFINATAHFNRYLNGARFNDVVDSILQFIRQH